MNMLIGAVIFSMLLITVPALANGSFDGTLIKALLDNWYPNSRGIFNAQSMTWVGLNIVVWIFLSILP
jgi:hypothetical protein